MALDTAKAVVTLNSLTAKFDNRVQAATPFYPRVSTIIPSTRKSEEYGLLGGSRGVREWLGDRQWHELRAGRFSIENKLWESSELIKKTDIDDDVHGIYGPLLEQLADEATYHPDEELFTLIINGETQACFDGQFFFDTDHAWGDSGTQSNDLTYNATDPNAVTATEFKAAYHAARKAMLQFKNDQGKFLNRPIAGGMRDLMIVVPPELEVAANEAISSIIISNSTNVVLDRPSIVVSPHLTTGTKFYLLNLGAPLKPFVFQDREPLTRQMKNADDIEFKDVKFMTQRRFNVGYLAWWTSVLTLFN